MQLSPCAVMGFPLAANGLWVLLLRLISSSYTIVITGKCLFEAVSGYGLKQTFRMALFGRVDGGIYIKAAG